MFSQLEDAKKWLLRGDSRSARGLYKKILKKEPKNCEALHGISLSYFQEQKYDDAEKCLIQAIAIDPSNPEFYNSLAIVYQNLASWPRAIQALESAKRAFETNPRAFDEVKYIKSLSMLAEIYMRQQRFEDAKVLLKIILKLQPETFGALKLLAQSYIGLGRYYHAIQTLEKLKFAPAILEALKVEVFLLKRDYRNALKCAEKCVQLDQSEPKFYRLLGECYIKTLQLEKSVEVYKKALTLDPADYVCLSRLLAVQVRICEWNERMDIACRLRAAALNDLTGECLRAIQPTIAILAGFSNKELLSIATAQSKLIEERSEPVRQKLKFTYRSHSKKLKIGYLSSDFHNHATLHLMLDVFGLHDRNKFEIYAYSYGVKEGGSYRKKLLKSCDHFIDVRMASDEEAAKKINEDEIDILVDLKGHISDHRLGILALKPAPLQIHYLGYPGTIGASFIDYLIADPYIIPKSERKYYSESIIYFPITYQANTAEKKVLKKQLKRKDYNLPEDVFIFCCFNQNDKLDPETIRVWIKILKSVPKSVLWLWGNYDQLKKKLDCYAEAHGIEAHRFIVSPSEPSPRHLARMRLADLFLDTFFYNAHTSCSDAIRVGLPVLTSPGKTFASRVAASLLHQLKLEDLIATSFEDYVSKAIELASNPKKLQKLKEKIEVNRERSRLYDPVLFTKTLDLSYLNIWKRHLAALPAIDVFL